VDVLCGGFPCQDVSSAGKHAGIKQGTRSGLWHEYRRIIGESRPKYAIIENVRGLLSLGIETVLQDLAGIGYDAEWTVLSAAVCGAPHRRERVFVVAYPHGTRHDGECSVLSALKGVLGDNQQYGGLFDWCGLRLDRARKTSARQAFGKPFLYRVDDGRSGGMDDAGRPLPGRIDRDTAKAWIRRLTALGNGITPHQAYAIAACILIAEGLPVPAMPTHC
jgi:DNA (cytosine-5)-methyltransferase 1